MQPMQLPLLASKHEPVMPKHVLIGCQTWHDWSLNNWSLADPNVNFGAVCLAPTDISWLYYKQIHLCKRRMHINTSQDQIWAWKFVPWSKLQMFNDQSSHIWHPIRACFDVTSSCLDASDGSCIGCMFTLRCKWRYLCYNTNNLPRFFLFHPRYNCCKNFMWLIN